MKLQEIALNKILDFKKSVSNGSKFTKSIVYENQGDIPVFGATQYRNKPTYGYIRDNVEGVKYFEDCLTWNIDGSLGCFYREGRFSLSEKVIPLYVNEQYKHQIDNKFLSFILLRLAIEQGFNREYKPNQTKLKELTIHIPIKEDGSFDLEAQEKIAKRYERVEKFQEQMKDYLKTIKNCIVKVELNKDTQYKKVDLKEIFNFYKGNAKYTNEYFFNIVGEYPVYSGATKNLGLVAHIDTYDYDTNGKQWLTWTTDGVYAGTVFVRNGKFSMNTHCGLLKPKDNFDSNLDIEYIAWVLNQTLPNHAIGDQNMRVTMGIINEVSIEIPIKEDGTFDLQEQQRIAKKYQNIESKRSQAIDMLKRVIDTQVKITME